MAQNDPRREDRVHAVYAGVDTALITTLGAAALYLAGFVYYNSMYGRIGFPRDSISHESAEYIRRGFMQSLDAFLSVALAVVFGLGVAAMLLMIMQGRRSMLRPLRQTGTTVAEEAKPAALFAFIVWMIIADTEVTSSRFFAIIGFAGALLATISWIVVNAYRSTMRPHDGALLGAMFVFAGVLLIAAAGEAGFEDGGTIFDRGERFQVATFHIEDRDERVHAAVAAIVAHSGGSYFVIFPSEDGRFYDRPAIIPDHVVRRIDLP